MNVDIFVNHIILKITDKNNIMIIFKKLYIALIDLIKFKIESKNSFGRTYEIFLSILFYLGIISFLFVFFKEKTCLFETFGLYL